MGTIEKRLWNAIFKLRENIIFYMYEDEIDNRVIEETAQKNDRKFEAMRKKKNKTKLLKLIETVFSTICFWALTIYLIWGFLSGEMTITELKDIIHEAHYYVLFIVSSIVKCSDVQYYYLDFMNGYRGRYYARMIKQTMATI